MATAAGLTEINPHKYSHFRPGEGRRTVCRTLPGARPVPGIRGGHQVKKTQKRHPISLFVRSALRSRRFAVGSTATSCALLLTAAGGVARAADQAAQPADQTNQEQLQEVVITGIRHGIESAIKAKEKSDLIEETISAEDIGKLPDTTIAESLARLPGVTTQRDSQGNATSVSIRGLGPDFNGYLMNGREQTSTLDSRAVDLSVYPAELIAGATVYKSGDAALMTAGLAGTIDQRLVDPLSYDHLIARGSYEFDRFNEGVAGQPVGKGKRYSLSFIDQFADRKLGLAIGFVHSDHDSASLNDSTWGNANYTAISPNGTNLGMAQFIAGINDATNNYSEKRDGGAVILKFKPNDVYSSEIDYYYAKLDLNQHITEAQAGFGGPPAITTITNATVVNGIIDSGTIAMPPYTNTATNPTNNGNPLIDRNEVIFDQDTIESFGWNHAVVLSEDWDVSLDINHNRAQRVERDNEAYATLDAANTLSFTNGVAAVGGGIPSLTLGTPYTDPTQVFIHSIDGWSGVKYPSGPFAGDTVPQAGYSKGPTITDTLYAGRLDFTHTLSNSLFSKLEFGANVSKRSKEYITDEGLIISTNPGGYGDISFPGSAFVAHDVGGTGLDFLSFSPGANLWPGAQILRKYNDDILSKTWTVTEKVNTLYAKLDIKTEWAGIPVRGNVGVQEVFTNQASEGYRANVSSSVTLTNPAFALTEEGTSYADFLPSLNLTGDFGNGNLLRFAVAEQIARPDMTAMRNSLAVALDTGSNPHPPAGQVTTYNTLVGSAGNPELKPFKATAFDLSYEKYFETKAYLSAAVFYKALNTYITQYTNFCGYDFTQLAQAVGVAIPTGPTGGCGGGALGTYTTQVNGHGGNIRGIELAASMPFSMLTSWLDGFGVTGSYSSTVSSVVVPNTIGLNPSQQVPVNLNMPLPDLSHVNVKGILYFEKWGFSAFVADNKRSQYIGTVANQTVGGYPALVYIEPQRWVSAQAGYEFQSGWLKGFGIRFEGTNLNKPKYQTVQTFGGPVTTVQTGANYDLRVFYKFED
jgi:iron complex outermembrane receptor protein